jgi:hypothetical protein
MSRYTRLLLILVAIALIAVIAGRWAYNAGFLIGAN